MDVGRVGQGGQTNYDNTIQNVEILKTSQGEKISNGEEFNVTPIKDKNVDNIKEEDIKKMVDKLNKFLEDEKTHAEYEVHDKLNNIMIKIVNNDTKEVILEIPPKKIQDMIAKMMEMVGLIVDKKA